MAQSLKAWALEHVKRLDPPKKGGISKGYRSPSLSRSSTTLSMFTLAAPPPPVSCFRILPSGSTRPASEGSICVGCASKHAYAYTHSLIPSKSRGQRVGLHASRTSWVSSVGSQIKAEDRGRSYAFAFACVRARNDCVCTSVRACCKCAGMCVSLGACVHT